jgi:hypothetical protein
MDQAAFVTAVAQIAVGLAGFTASAFASRPAEVPASALLSCLRYAVL